MIPESQRKKGTLVFDPRDKVVGLITSVRKDGAAYIQWPKGGGMTPGLKVKHASWDYFWKVGYIVRAVQLWKN